MSDTINANLINNGGFEKGLTGWKIADKNAPAAAAHCSIVTGDSAALFVDKPGDAAVMANTPGFPLRPQTPYAFKIRYKTEGTDNASPLVVRMMVWGKDKPQIKNYLWVWLKPASNWTVKEVKGNAYFTNDQADKGFITLMFQGKGKVWVDEIELHVEDTLDTTLDIGGKNFSYKPRAQMADPLRSDLDSIQVYQRDPRAVYPDSVPQPGETISELKKFAAPGERAAFHFAVYAAQDEELQDIQIDNLTGPQGNLISGNIFQKKTISFWKQRTATYEQSYYIIPELVNNFETTKIDAHSSQLFWLPFQVPQQTAPGEYRGRVRLIFAGGKTRQIPLSLRVLPFTPISPQADWIMYATMPVTNVITGKPFTRAQQVKYFRGMSDYGITGLVPMRIWPNYDYNDGKITNIHFTPMSFDEFFAITREAGLQGPMVWEMEHLVEAGIIQKITGKAPLVGKWPLAENSLPAVQNGFKSILSEVKRQADKYGEWYYFGMDEPHNEGRMPQVEWEFRMARAAGARTSTSVYPFDAVSQLAPLMDMDINSFIGDSKKDYEKYQELAKQHSLKYWYLAAGCYTGQEGGLMPNRYLSGFLFYKLGVPAHVSWIYQWSKGDPANDFDGTGSEQKDLCITYPSADNENATISTLQWEGIREGIIDYKYAATLQKYIDLAEQKHLTKEAAAGRQVMAKVMAAVPWRKEYQSENSYSQPGNFSNELADKLRWMLADEIIRLKEALHE